MIPMLSMFTACGGNSQQVHAQTQVKWEYKIVNSVNADKLNKLGNEGWELVIGDIDGIGVQGVFKRKLP